MDLETTKALFDGDWLNSGDMGYMVNGEIYVTGRTKDIIIRAGRNIYPDELEHAIGENWMILEMAVLPCLVV